MEDERYGTIDVRIRGVTPLLMNRMTSQSLKGEDITVGKTYDVNEEAQRAAYIEVIDGKKQLYIPSEAVYVMTIQTAAPYRVKLGGRRVSASSVLAGAIRIEPEKIPLGRSDYEVDVRPSVIQRSRVLRSRAKVNLPWEASFSIRYYKRLVSATLVETLKEILQDAGVRMGLLDYRPQHKGWFGTFEVAEFNPR